MNEKLKEEIQKTREVLSKGGIILYPTDTIWGLGCDATNAEAVKRIYEIKKRADNKSMLVLLDDAGKIASYADVPDIALDLIEVADKPLTIIYPGAKKLASLRLSLVSAQQLRESQILPHLSVQVFFLTRVASAADWGSQPWSD